MQKEPEHKPQGAMLQNDGHVCWRVWSPLSDNVSLVLFLPEGREEAIMTPEGHGYFVHQRRHENDTLRYMYKLSDGGEFPDPASRWQPEGIHRPSALFFPESYTWSDKGWRGVSADDLVIYELHVGAFTPEGTFEAIIPRLKELSSLGVTAIEIMPIAQFSGDRNWGYDGVHPFAVQNSYGGPHAFQRLIDAAHYNHLAVILDVVYNHIGPEGNYFAKFGPYFTDRYHTPWGKAVNFDGPDSDPVRQFVIDNACAWVRDFHVDGLRMDAVQTIYDFSARHILADVKEAVKQDADSQGRIVHVVAETNQNDVRLINRPEQGGYGLDAVWSDDFHHSVHALLTGERDGYYQDFGHAEDLAKSYNRVFVYDGCYSPFLRRRHGSQVGSLERTRFVVCVQNHDQVGNRAQGDRFGSILSPSAQRLACGLLLLSPCVPLLFMGEEYGERRPFPFFCSFSDAGLIEAVRRGRREEFAALRFDWSVEIPDPQSPETFLSAKLAWAWPDGSLQAKHRRLYEDLLAARRQWPALRDREHTNARLIDADLDNQDGRPSILLLERGGENGLLALANLSAKTAIYPHLELAGKHVMLSTEYVRYGGSRLECQSSDRLLPHEMLVLGGSKSLP
jgi:maltooligosyltrehalose trehalohydrolase